jgi:DNA-binding phage protein
MQHVNRKLTPSERRRHALIRAAAHRDFPPKRRAADREATGALPAAIRQARKRQRLTWYALAQKAGIPNQATIRAIEQGKDVKLSSLQAVAQALGLKLELVATADRT